MTERVGTIYTMAPQVLQGIYTSQADCWAVGVIAFTLLSDSKPFDGKERKDIVDKIMRCDYQFKGPAWKTISPAAKDFVSALIVLDPWKRLTASRALKHTWLTTIRPTVQNEQVYEDVHRSLYQYAKCTKLKKLALMFIAHKSSTEEIVKLREVFAAYDNDNDGTINLADFKRAFAQFNSSDEDLERLFRQVVRMC